MIITQYESPQNSSKTLKQLMSPRKMGTKMKRMTGMIPLSALMQPAGPVAMILTRPGISTQRTIIKSITRGSIKRVGDVVPLMPEKRKINIRGKQSCHCSRTPRRKAHSHTLIGTGKWKNTSGRVMITTE